MIDYIRTLRQVTKRYPRLKGEGFISYWRFWMGQAWHNEIDVMCVYHHIKKWCK